MSYFRSRSEAKPFVLLNGGAHKINILGIHIFIYIEEQKKFIKYLDTKKIRGMYLF